MRFGPPTFSHHAGQGGLHLVPRRAPPFPLAKLKKGNSAELNSYESKQLGSRKACQFTKPLPVKIISFDSNTNQVNVEMEVENRLKGTIWWLDASAIME
jgi:hypothetical protein